MIKKQFEKLSDKNITKLEYDEIISEITNRCDEIIKKISTNFTWWDFENYDYDSHDSGYFDLNSYQEEIGITGQFKIPNPYGLHGYQGFCCGFPTRWLWEDNWFEEFKKEVSKEKDFVQAEKERKKQLRIDRKKRYAELHKSIKEKLTKEELKSISFKKV